jgi:hypothetical protein
MWRHVTRIWATTFRRNILPQSSGKVHISSKESGLEIEADKPKVNVYSSPSIIGMIKSKRKRWAGHVARMGRREMHTVYWWESQMERDYWEDQGVSG